LSHRPDWFFEIENDVTRGYAQCSSEQITTVWAKQESS